MLSGFITVKNGFITMHNLLFGIEYWPGLLVILISMVSMSDFSGNFLIIIDKMTYNNFQSTGVFISYWTPSLS